MLSFLPDVAIGQIGQQWPFSCLVPGSCRVRVYLLGYVAISWPDGKVGRDVEPGRFIRGIYSTSNIGKIPIVDWLARSFRSTCANAPTMLVAWLWPLCFRMRILWQADA